MQNRLAHLKIAGGQQRHRSAVKDPTDGIVDLGAPVQVPTPVGFAELQLGRVPSLSKDKRLPIVR